jgi:hypothetical protein
MRAAMLRRRAILIGCGGEEGSEEYLPGVTVDLENYWKFLNSDEGGAWDEGEITVLEEPPWRLAATHLLGGERYHFTLTSFHGHGAFDPYRRKTQIQFGDGLMVDLVQLRTGSQRELIMTDSCRTFPEPIPEGRIKIGADFGYEPNARRRASCRQLYDRALASADPGTSFVLGCGVGEAADESPDGGGEFSDALISVCDAWSAVPTRPLASAVLTISDAIGMTQGVLQRRRVTQRPTYRGGRRQRHFPIAVR